MEVLTSIFQKSLVRIMEFSTKLLFVFLTTAIIHEIIAGEVSQKVDDQDYYNCPSPTVT